LAVLFIFWIINDFGPVYATMVVSNSTYNQALGPKKAFSWRESGTMGSMPKNKGSYAEWRQQEGARPKKNQQNASRPRPKLAANASWENSRPARAHFLATEELFLMDAPTEAMVRAHLRYVAYFAIFYAVTPFLFILLKWLVVQRLPSRAHPLFASIVQRHFFIWMLSQTWFVPFMTMFSGTLAVNSFYRLLGSKVGRRTLLLGMIGHYGDVDQWEIGSDTVVDGYIWQSHTFEDRVFWVMKTVIGDRCYVGPLTKLMGGSKVGNDVNVLPLSVAWKMQELPPGTEGKPRSYHGSPPVEIEVARHGPTGCDHN